MFLPGLGGPGSGYAGMQAQGMMQGPMTDWLQLAKAGGYGFGPYGYALGYGLVPYGQQARMLNHQWGLRGFDHGIR